MRLIRQFFALSLLLLSLGCAGNSPMTHFYLLEPPMPQAVEQPLATDLVLGITPVQISGSCADDRLVFREDPFEIKYYHYHRWATPLSGRVSQLLFDQLQAANPGVDVLIPPFAKRPDILVNVRLTACEEIDGLTGWIGRMSYFASARQADGTMLFGKTFSCDTPCDEQHPRAVVAALSQSFAACTADLILELQAHMAE
ncbi:membrane integrity-associated transporter subunit PqiC [bacterium]|nr:membrane integrity-associated transporter subunit PqiC [bacterium]